MKAREVPDFFAALEDLSPHFLTFYDAFEVGFDHGKGFFEGIDAACDLHLHAHLIRFFVKRHLDELGFNTEYEAEDLGNSGIQLTVRQWFIRIRKSARGAMPSPARSKKLKGYYQQELPGDFADKHNLLLLWHATPLGDFKGLSLVYPLSASITKWRLDIPHPAASAHEKSAYGMTYQPGFDDMGNIEDLGDLDIEPLTEEDDDSEAESQ